MKCKKCGESMEVDAQRKTHICEDCNEIIELCNPEDLEKKSFSFAVLISKKLLFRFLG